MLRLRPHEGVAMKASGAALPSAAVIALVLVLVVEGAGVPVAGAPLEDGAVPALTGKEERIVSNLVTWLHGQGFSRGSGGNVS